MWVTPAGMKSIVGIYDFLTSKVYRGSTSVPIGLNHFQEVAVFR
jgi:hypothetical protein